MDNPVFARIQQEINENDVVLFMKGNPMFPQCGFSAALVQALTMMEVKFTGVDVLADPFCEVPNTNNGLIIYFRQKERISN